MSISFQDAVTDFIFLRDEPEKSDIIFVPGASHSLHVVLAAGLYREGYAPKVLPSGRFSTSQHAFPDPAYDSEWAWMRSILLKNGVPEEDILREDQARYTWDNAVKSRQATDNLGMKIRQAILCCRPFHARRALFYYQTAFPETKFLVCPAEEPGLDRNDWHTTPEGRQRVLAEVRRLGDQINQVWEEALQKRN